MRKLPRLLRIAATAGVLALTACGGGSSESAAGFNDADVEFAQGTVAHHEQAIEMSESALDPTTAAGAAVRDLARRISDAQDGEISTMSGWLKTWNKPVQMDTTDGHDMADMEGMMSADELKQLGSATGTEFDRLWLTMMIAHHKGAISQSKTAQDKGKHADVKALAAEIITAQQGEITEMQSLLGG